MTETTTEELSDIERENIVHAANQICESFTYGKTTSGADYWRDVEHRLRQLARSSPPRCEKCNQVLPNAG